MVEITHLETIVKRTNKWLGNEGRKHFIKVLLRENDLISEHFTSGMQIRNFLRSLDECKDWDAHEFDNNWMYIIKECLRQGNKK